MIERRSIEFDGEELSYLAGGSGPALVLLHGTFWSRVWEPVLSALAMACRVVALDFPGFGRSGGRLGADRADVPSLAGIVVRFLERLDVSAPVAVAGHDIGGAVAQWLVAKQGDRFNRLVLMNSVLYDSWPVPAVARFRDPAVAEGIGRDEFLDARRQSLERATARELSAAERDDYLSPWKSDDRVRSWIAMAAAADPRYTLEVVDHLRELAPPTLLVWGQDDEFQPVEYAGRFAGEIPGAELVTVEAARHIPTEDNPDRVADAIRTFSARTERGR